MPDDKAPERYPDLPWSSITVGTFYPFREEELASRGAVEELIALMFNKPEAAFYLYTRVGHAAPPSVIHAEKRGELHMTLAKRPFYLHHAGKQNTFTQVAEASKGGIEYQQITLRLTERMIRELTISQTLAVIEANKPAEPVLQLKPSVFGFGIDLKAIWKRLRGGK